MTVCNMTIEGGGRAGMIAPDETTFDWVEGRPGAPAGLRGGRRALARRCRPTRARASTPRSRSTPPRSRPMVTWGTNPGHGRARSPARSPSRGDRGREERALALHGPRAGTRDRRRSQLDRVFIGSCTNSRIEDLREAAAVVEGRKVAGDAERDGRPRLGAGQGRRPRPRASTRSSAPPASTGASAGCSMCLGMNPDILSPGERCASTSNRNFEGRQGKGGRTHLVSARRWPRRPRSRASSSTSGSWS